MIKATPLILRKIPRAKIVIAGSDCGYLTELKALAYRLGIQSSVVFTETLPNKDLKALYADSDVIVIPSIEEPFSLTALEAMACGKPIVASDVGGLSSLLRHGENALLVRPRDVYGLAKAVIALLSDCSLRRVMGSLNRRVVTKYSWERVVDAIEGIYYEALT